MKIAVCGISPGSFHYRTYATYLAERGHDVTAITNADEVDAPVHVVNFARSTVMSRALPRGTGWTQRAFSLWRALHGHGFDVVNVQQMTPDGVLAALLWGGPLVLTLGDQTSCGCTNGRAGCGRSCRSPCAKLRCCRPRRR